MANQTTESAIHLTIGNNIIYIAKQMYTDEIEPEMSNAEFVKKIELIFTDQYVLPNLRLVTLSDLQNRTATAR